MDTGINITNGQVAGIPSILKVSLIKNLTRKLTKHRTELLKANKQIFLIRAV